jgi:hypothetical protein
LFFGLFYDIRKRSKIDHYKKSERLFRGGKKEKEKEKIPLAFVICSF